MRNAYLEPRYLQFLPRELEAGVLYISEKYTTAAHLCCCGCGQKVVTPLRTTEWNLVKGEHGVSLYPSIGNWGFPCRSHYVIRNNRVIWAGGMSDHIIRRNRKLDRRMKDEYFGRSSHSIASRLIGKLTRWWNS